ncbi:MAG: DUF1467 family protein [Alphaproteobacteria bacterium]|nr:DUF1467 family protein [Alphaproteobacteria bacterium]MDA7987926.1 DUF1467 family protein [Alphaproteobacteria bacterium]
MALVTGIAAFLTIWCVVLFLVLPFGVEAEDDPEVGWDAGAPREHRMGLKLVSSFIVSAVLFVVWRVVAGVMGWP